jgi:uncharacterized protein YicC (UPF0701 family)
MSETTNKPGLDIWVELDLFDVKSKLGRKILKKIKKGKIEMIIDVEISDLEADSIEINTGSFVSCVKEKRKKNKKK